VRWDSSSARAFLPPACPPLKGHGATIVKLGFLAGGVAFLLGSYPMLPELFTQLRTRGCA
jgi:hypothetical protein